MAEQIRRAVGWIYHNAAQLGVDPGQIYLGGHSSGGHLCGVALVTDWAARGLPDNIVKAGLCMSGLYEMLPVRLSKRSAYLKFTPESEAAMSAIRQLDRLRVPVTVTYGGDETPEFQRQSREFAKASNATLIAVPDHNHFEMALTLGDPYGANGRAALGMMGLRTASSTRSQ